MQDKFIAALFTIAKTWKESLGPLTDDWTRKMYTVYIHKGIPLSHKKKNEIMPFAARWMELKKLILSKSERKRQIP